MIAHLTASITLKERAIRHLKEQFGVDVYPLMSPVWKGVDVEKLVRSTKQQVEKKEAELREKRLELAEIRSREKRNSLVTTVAESGEVNIDATPAVTSGEIEIPHSESVATDQAMKGLGAGQTADQEAGVVHSIVFVDTDGGTISMETGLGFELEDSERGSKGGETKNRENSSKNSKNSGKSSREMNRSRAWANDMKMNEKGTRRRVEF